MGPTGSPETSILNHMTPRNNPEDGEISSTAAEACDVSRFSLSKSPLFGM
jgi:hypothetical protein